MDACWWTEIQFSLLKVCINKCTNVKTNQSIICNEEGILMNTATQRNRIKKADTQKQYYLMASYSDKDAINRFRTVPYCGMFQKKTKISE